MFTCACGNTTKHLSKVCGRCQQRLADEQRGVRVDRANCGLVMSCGFMDPKTCSAHYNDPRLRSVADYPAACPKCDLPGMADRDCFDYECGSQFNAPGIFGVPEGFCQSKACTHIVRLKGLSVEGEYPLDDNVKYIFTETRQFEYIKSLIEQSGHHLFRYPHGPQKFADLEDHEGEEPYVNRYAHHIYMLGIGRL